MQGTEHNGQILVTLEDIGDAAALADLLRQLSRGDGSIPDQLCEAFDAIIETSSVPDPLDPGVTVVPITLPCELLAWAERQPEGLAALVYRLLVRARDTQKEDARWQAHRAHQRRARQMQEEAHLPEAPSARAAAGERS